MVAIYFLGPGNTEGTGLVNIGKWSKELTPAAFTRVGYRRKERTIAFRSHHIFWTDAHHHNRFIIAQSQIIVAFRYYSYFWWLASRKLAASITPRVRNAQRALLFSVADMSEALRSV
jgi:hypothetical protein